MVKISAFADEVSIVFDEQVEYLTKAGIKWIEIRFVDGKNITTLSDEEVMEVKEKLNKASIGVSAIASPIGKYAIDAPFEEHMNLFRRTVKIAQMLDAGMIRIFSFYGSENVDIEVCKEEVLRKLKAFSDEVKDTGISLVHENEAGIFGHSASNCEILMKNLYSDNFKAAYDPANFVWGEKITDNIFTCWPILKQYVSHIHIKDWKLGSKDIGSIPGDGDGQIAELFKELADKGYNGFVTLEPHMSSGGQFGGQTTTDQFDAALSRVRSFCQDNGIIYE